MSVEIVYAFGNPNIGVYVAVNEKVAIIPPDAPSKLEEALKRALKVEEVYRTTINASFLVGTLCAMNSHGIVIGRFVRNEASFLKRVLGDSMAVEVLEDVKENALGNLVLANDRGAIVSPLFPKHAVRKIADALDVEVIQRPLGRSDLVGAVGVATNRGVILSPIVSDEEVELAADVLKVEKSGIGTVNRGSVFIRGGLVANSKGALVGYETTGIELMRIQSVLF